MVQNYDLGENLSREIIFKILIGVSHLHNIHLIHRDLKLEHIFIKFIKVNNITKLDYVKIIDLGFATKLDCN